MMLRKETGSPAIADIRAALTRIPLVGLLGWQDVLRRYRRSVIGPFWITISMGVLIGTIGFVFGQIFESPLEEYLPFLAAGIIIWMFFSSIITEGCSVFISAEGIIKQLSIPLFVHVLRMIWKNTIVFAHNLLILPVVYLFLGKSIGLDALLSVFGFLLVILNLSWMALLVGIICTRYRDLPQIVSSVLQVAFYLTPIIWMPSLLPERAIRYFLELNPLFYLVEIIRSPLLGTGIDRVSWVVVIIMAMVGWFLTLLLYGRYKSRIAYWL